MEVATKPVYIKHSDLRESNKQHVNLSLCDALNNLIPNHIVAAQHIGGVWLIWIKTEGAREFLMKKVITLKYNGWNIELHEQNPYTSEKIPSEKIVIRELPCDIENKDVIAYI